VVFSFVHITVYFTKVNDRERKKENKETKTKRKKRHIIYVITYMLVPASMLVY